jgi:DNA-binding NtrC family response regulator
MASVLIVDDEALIRWSVAESLESAGHDVLEAGTAAEALRLMDSNHDDIGVAVLDLRLPDSSDLGLLRRIRQSAPACRIILMTAHGTPEMLDEAIGWGAFAVLTKPFDMDSVVSLVDRAGSKSGV